MKKIHLVDVSYMFFRAYYAIPPLNSENGTPTNAILGFLNMTVKLLKNTKGDQLVYCFDSKEPSFRTELYEDYKANRDEIPDDLSPQIPYVQKLTEILGIPFIKKPGYEADDIIGTICSWAKKEGMESVIVSADKDFAQLVDSSIKMHDVVKGVLYDEKKVVEKWGVYPSQMVDYLALVGDTSDNIPGVKGVGPKTAQKLLSEYKDLNGVYKNVDSISSKSIKEKLKQDKKMAFLSQELVTIVTNLKIKMKKESFELKPVDEKALREVLSELSFKHFEEKFLGEEDPSKKENEIQTTSEESSWSLKDFEKKIKKNDVIYSVPYPRGVVFGFKDETIIPKGDIQKIGALLEKKQVSWKGFDIRKTWMKLDLKKGSTPLFDGDISSHILTSLVFSSFQEAHSYLLMKDLSEMSPPSAFLKAQKEMEEVLEDKIRKEETETLLKDIELPLVPILYAMEKEGVKLDVKELQSQSENLSKRISKLQKDIFKMTDSSFNIDSSKQLGEVLFEKLNLPVLRKTKTQYSTDKGVLLKLKQKFPVCGLILEYRELVKLKSTYVDAFPRLLNVKTKRIHTHFRQTVTTTGRLSSVHPNLQNIPIRTETGRKIRKAFVAERGKLLLFLDYNQIELRVLAHISGDKGLINAFKKDLDVHKVTASEIFGCPIEDVTSELRQRAKGVNFGLVYGQGPYGLAEVLGIHQKEASKIIESYFKKFPGVKAYMVNVVEAAQKRGYVKTVYGRKRYVPQIRAKGEKGLSFLKRAVINAPIQGTASDIVKKAMIEIYEKVESPLLLQVHDELIFECEKEKVKAQAKKIKMIMENCVQLKVPMKVKVSYGKNWLETKSLES